MLKVGVIGLGLMGKRHAEIYNKIPYVELAAVADSNEKILKEFCTNNKVKGYRDYKELLLDESIDAVSVCLPDNMHFDSLKLAIEKNKHILVEKPITLKSDEGKEICDLLKGKNLVFTVGHILRFDPRFTGAKKYIDENFLGDIVVVNSRRNSPITGPLHYKGFTDLSFHVMVHDIDAINWLVGSHPKSVFAKSRKFMLKQYNMTDAIFAIIEYENGVLANLEACWVLPENSPSSIDDKMELIGEKGALYIDSCDKGLNLVSKRKIEYPDSRHWPEINREIGGALFEEILSFVNDIIHGRNPIITAEDAVIAVEVVEKINESIRKNKEVFFK